jgi:hypothetical protein
MTFFESLAVCGLLIGDEVSYTAEEIKMHVCLTIDNKTHRRQLSLNMIKGRLRVLLVQIKK